MDDFSSAAASRGGFQVLPQFDRYASSPSVPGASQHSAIFSASSTSFHDDLLSFLSYVKTRQIPIFSVALPDVRSVLGRGASFFVNGAEMPETCVEDVSGEIFPKGSVVALKRAIVPPDAKNIQEGLTRRIQLLSNEVLTMKHPPLAAHPNIVQLLGIGFEVEGHESNYSVIPILVPECAELGNLAEILETAKREGRPLVYNQKLQFCIDIAHGLEALHACDIIHGDVKCENVLVFETAGTGQEERALTCKIIDFGYSHLDNSREDFSLGGSPPWQAPELLEGQYLKIESAKGTDIYSFGLLMWRLMLDGDPFEPLESFEANLKRQDKLIEHVCGSLKSSGVLDEQQLRMICRVIERTLMRDPTHRESSMANIIKLLTPNFWYQSSDAEPLTQVLEPERVSYPQEIELLDIEKHYHEFRKVDGVVKEKIAQSYHDFLQNPTGNRLQFAGAAYQLAVCYALGFGLPFTPKESVRWLEIAAMNGFQRAKETLPRFRMVFDKDLEDYIVPPINSMGEMVIEPAISGSKETSTGSTSRVEISGGKFVMNGKNVDEETLFLEAVRTHQLDIVDLLLTNGVQGDTSTNEGVTAFHYLTTWDTSQIETLGKKLIKCGADIDACARKGTSVGGTPLMWCVYEERLEHTKILLSLGASPTATDTLGLSALSLCARLHIHSHLRMLLMHTRAAIMATRRTAIFIYAVRGR